MEAQNDWREIRLSEVTLPTATWNPRTNKRSSIRYVDVSAVDRDLLMITSHAEHTPDNAPSRARKIVREGDTIFATVRPTLRRIAQVPSSLDGEIVSTAFCVLRPNPEQLDPGFLHFAVQTDEVLQGIAALETGASYPAVRDSDILDQVIKLPSLREQADITNVLSSIRTTLLSECESGAATRNLKRSTMRALFTRGLRGEPQKDTEIGPIPESWDVARIDDVTVRIQYGLSVRGQSCGLYPILRMNCQDDGRVVFRDLQYADLDQQTFESFRLEHGDLLFNRTNSIQHVGRTAIFENSNEAVFASYLIRMTVDQSRCLPRYLNYYLNSPAVQADIKKLASRAVGQANINASKLRTVAIPLAATLDEQREIIAILDAIDRKIHLHRRKRAVLDELFKALLHKLMTGEIRVAELDLSALTPDLNAEVTE